MLRVNARSLEAVTHTHTLYVYRINKKSNKIRDGDCHIKRDVVVFPSLFLEIINRRYISWRLKIEKI